MAAATNNLESVDFGGQVLMVKAIKTGFNSPGNNPNTLGTADTSNGVNAGSSLTMTRDLHLGTAVLLNTVASTVTLPPATGTGNVYNLYITTTTTSNHVVQAAGSDKIFGVATVGATTGGSFTVNNNTTFTMSATTTGGIKGGSFYFTDLALNMWVVEANLVGTGTAATPISA